jgi:hypothetical protein
MNATGSVIPVMTELTTVICGAAVLPSLVAVMAAVPTAAPVTSSCAETVAMAASPDDHWTARPADQRLLGAVRRTGTLPQGDLIVVTRSTVSPELLVTLARALENAIERQGAVPTSPVNIYYYRRERRWPPISASERRWATRVIADLQVAPRTALPRIGDQPSVATTFTPD